MRFERQLAVMLCLALLFSSSHDLTNCRAEGSAASAPSLVVELVDGRRVEGKLASETDKARLWVLRSSQGVTLRSGFAWESIKRVLSGIERVSTAELLVLARRQKAPEGEKAEEISALPIENLHQTVPAAPPSKADRSARLASLRIEACLTNWDEDPQLDGLLVFVFPLDAAGRLVHVHGNLDLTLVGVTQIVPGTSWEMTPEFPELERKSHAVRTADFAEGPAMYRVPFVRVEPDYDARLTAAGLLHARLRVPGVGAFDASTTCLELREFSPLRDHMWQHTGRRYLHLEDAGRSGR